MTEAFKELVHIPVDNVYIEGMLELPANAQGLVLFAHGSGSSRHSPRNKYVAGVLHEQHIGTLLIDLLTPEEDMDYEMRFDIPLLTRRLIEATHWVSHEGHCWRLPLAYFGASTGAAAALQAAAAYSDRISAVVSRGGRPDLAGRNTLKLVRCPTLLLVGGLDDVVIELNQQAFELMECSKELTIIPGATHLFDEAGTLEEVARLAADWLGRHLQKKT